MKHVSDISSVARQAVGCVAFEIIPDLFDRIEFRCVCGKAFQMQARVVAADLRNVWALVDSRLIPKKDDVSAQVVQKFPEKLGHMKGLEVVLLEANIEPDAFSNRGDGDRSQRRDAVVFVAVADDRGLSLWPPSPAARRDEQETAFIEEGQVGPKSLRVFLYAATCTASSARWPSRRVGWRAVPELDKTSPSGGGLARRGLDDTPRRTPCESPRQCVEPVAMLEGWCFAGVVGAP